jgi:hypothetical protein
MRWRPGPGDVSGFVIIILIVLVSLGIGLTEEWASHETKEQVTLRMTEDCYRALDLDIMVPFKCAQYMTKGEIK